MEKIVDLAAVVIDCQVAMPIAEFYQAACGGEIVRSGGGSVWLKVNGATVIFREVENHKPPTWSSPDVPMQILLHLPTQVGAQRRLSATRQDPRT